MGITQDEFSDLKANYEAKKDNKGYKTDTEIKKNSKAIFKR